jgi:hypothetical protein
MPGSAHQIERTMLNFTKTFKLYVFKKDGRVDIAIRIANHYVQTYNLSIDEMKELLSKWDTPEGFNQKINNMSWMVQHKKSSPRPVQTPVDYVRFSIFINGVGNNFRVDADDMLALEKDFFYQINNRMYWDQ